MFQYGANRDRRENPPMRLKKVRGMSSINSTVNCVWQSAGKQ
jgi:hypothetical protein